MFWIAFITYYAFVVLRASIYFGVTKEPKEAGLPSISVIIPARNEAQGIAACLTSVLAQQYEGTWEVILVNDHSTDETAGIAQSFMEQSQRFSIIDLADGEGKKAALSTGIAQARYDIILQTDADCTHDLHWIAAMAAAFEEQTTLVSGPVILTHDGSAFQRLQSLEYMGLVTLGAGSLLAGHPNMANGANLAYRKTAFEAVGGFSGVDHVASGDDELLLQKLRKAGLAQFSFAKSREAIVRTPAQVGWQAFKRQRLRWVSKARAYTNRWVNLTQVMSWLAFFGIAIHSALALMGKDNWAGLLWAIKLIADCILMGMATRFFQREKLLGWFLSLQIVYLPYVLWIGIAGNAVSSYRWKEREVK